MNYWIFQSVPERYDLREETNLHEGLEGSWNATRYRTRMAKGDLIYFWMGGSESERGIYGWGTISSEPFENNGEYRVGIRVSKRLPKHIQIDSIRKNPELSNLMILRMAVGTNFLINNREAAALRLMMPPNFQPEEAKNV
jgi:predicted RNA-binding protein with PUA-like domain